MRNGFSSGKVDEPCRVVIIGMMGSGKTTIGRLLSKATGWPRFDNDQLLHQLFGMTPKELLEARGEAYMREAEDAALALGLKADPPFIVDAAAGTIMSQTSRALLMSPIVIWLTASPELLFRRAVGGAHRPWLDGGENWIRDTARERHTLYASVADIVMDTDGRSPTNLAAELLTQLREFCHAPAAPVP